LGFPLRRNDICTNEIRYISHKSMYGWGMRPQVCIFNTQFGNINPKVGYLKSSSPSCRKAFMKINCCFICFLCKRPTTGLRVRSITWSVYWVDIEPPYSVLACTYFYSAIQVQLSQYMYNAPYVMLHLVSAINPLYPFVNLNLVPVPPFLTHLFLHLSLLPLFIHHSAHP